jgi:hypothetical protein
MIELAIQIIKGRDVIAKIFPFWVHILFYRTIPEIIHVELRCANTTRPVKVTLIRNLRAKSTGDESRHGPPSRPKCRADSGRCEWPFQ